MELQDEILSHFVSRAAENKYEIYWIEDAVRKEIRERSKMHRIKSAWVPLIEKVHQSAAEQQVRDRSSTASTEETVTDEDKELEANGPSSLLVAKLTKLDQCISNLERSAEELWEYETIGLATRVNTQLVRPILDAWNFVLHTMDQEKIKSVANSNVTLPEKAWKDFMSVCHHALEVVESPVFVDPRDTWRDKLFGRGHQKSLVREIKELKESAEDLLNFTVRFNVSASNANCDRLAGRVR